MKFCYLFNKCLYTEIIIIIQYVQFNSCHIIWLFITYIPEFHKQFILKKNTVHIAKMWTVLISHQEMQCLLKSWVSCKIRRGQGDVQAAAETRGWADAQRERRRRRALSLGRAHVWAQIWTCSPGTAPITSSRSGIHLDSLVHQGCCPN